MNLAIIVGPKLTAILFPPSLHFMITGCFKVPYLVNFELWVAEIERHVSNGHLRRHTSHYVVKIFKKILLLDSYELLTILSHHIIYINSLVRVSYTNHIIT
jgi:hypothetical protein